MRMYKILIGFFAVVFFSNTAWAQVPKNVPAPVLEHSLNSNGYAVPDSAANPHPVTGTITIGQPGTYTQISITTGGVDQTLATPTNGYQISNPDPSENCWVAEGTAAVANQGDPLVANGGWVKSPDAYKPGIPHVLCATTSHKLTYRYW